MDNHLKKMSDAIFAMDRKILEAEQRAAIAETQSQHPVVIVSIRTEAEKYKAEKAKLEREFKIELTVNGMEKKTKEQKNE